MNLDNPFLLEDNLQDKLERRIINYRNYAYELNVAEYFEELLSLISYHSNKSLTELGFNESDCEFFLRMYGSVVLGIKIDDKKVHVLGTMTNQNTYRNSFYNKPFILSGTEKLSLITVNNLTKTIKTNEYDYFVLGYNKKINIISDFEVIKHYSELHAETSASMLSLVMQSKVNTFIQTSDIENEDSNEVIYKLYNGSGYIKTSELFNVDKQIINYSAVQPEIFAHLDNQLLTTQRILNNSLGLSDIAVNKESGISETEAKSNTASKKAKQDTYLKPRQDMLDLVNRLLKIDMSCEFSTENYDNLSTIEKKELEDDKNHNTL